MVFASRTVASIAAAAVAVVAVDVAVAINRAATDHDTTPVAVATATPSATPSASPIVVSASPSASTTPSGRPSSSQHHLAAVLSQVYDRALAQHTVHSRALGTTAKGAVTTFDNYDGEQSGEQHISINGGHLEVRVIGTTTYLNGDAKGLAVYGVDARSLHGQWIALRPGQKGYRSVTAGVTLASALRADKIAGPLTREPAKTLDTQRVYGITGRGVGANSPRGSTSTIWISKDTGLPVEFDAKTDHTTITESFTEWGTPIHVAPPTDVVGQHTISG